MNIQDIRGFDFDAIWLQCAESSAHSRSLINRREIVEQSVRTCAEQFSAHVRAFITKCGSVRHHCAKTLANVRAFMKRRQMVEKVARTCAGQSSAHVRAFINRRGMVKKLRARAQKFWRSGVLWSRNSSNGAEIRIRRGGCPCSST